MGLISDLVTGWFGSHAEEKAANQGMEASQYATDQSLKYLRETRDLTRSDNEPWRLEGVGALGRLHDLSVNPNSFTADPGYQWRMDQGVNALDRSQAAGGKLNGGGTQKALIRYGQGFGSNEFQNVWNRQAGLAGVGQTANNANAQAGQSFANGASNALMQNGQNRMSGYNAIGQSKAGFWGGVGGSLNGSGNMIAQLMGGF